MLLARFAPLMVCKKIIREMDSSGISVDPTWQLNKKKFSCLVLDFQ